MSEPLQITVGDERVSGRLYRAAGPRARVTLVLGHGAGADQSSAFLVEYSEALAARGLDVMTFNFVYSEQKRGAPDRPPKLEACWRAAIETARPLFKDHALVIGGKSMGGRIASQVAAAGVDGLRALVFLGYPLHPPDQPDKLRIAHLPNIRLPMLFVQGDRDPFGSPAELTPILAPLEPAPLIVPIAGGDHSFKVAKRDGGGPHIHTAIQDQIVRWLRETLQ
ncbi:MAG TPA: alpha/beta family hydrolase [Polyangia bacterium]|nr:alpha/beta family hydrolase [Polyangia bacterium]